MNPEVLHCMFTVTLQSDPLISFPSRAYYGLFLQKVIMGQSVAASRNFRCKHALVCQASKVLV